MKTSIKVVGSTIVLIAATLGLQAQATNQTNPGPSKATASPSNSNSTTAVAPTAPEPKNNQEPRSDQFQSTPPASLQNSPSAQHSANPVGTTTTGDNATVSNGNDPTGTGLNTNGSQQPDAAHTNIVAPRVTQDAGANPNPADIPTGQAPAITNAGISPQSSTSSQSDRMASAQSETQITTVVQQIDTQGPAVVEQVTTQFADITCTPENAKLLFNALHDGTEVALSANGKTATFKPAGDKLGYGDAFVALALAAEALHHAGVTGCATPEQWQAVLIGGPLAVSETSSTHTSTTASAHSSSDFPGILTLHSQGQGWSQIAQTTNVQLGQVVSSARSSFKLNADSGLTPTGKTSAEMMQDRMNAGKDKDPTTDGHAKSLNDADKDGHHDDQGKDRGDEKGVDQNKGADDATAGAATQPNR